MRSRPAKLRGWDGGDRGRNLGGRVEMGGKGEEILKKRKVVLLTREYACIAG